MAKTRRRSRNNKPPPPKSSGGANDKISKGKNPIQKKQKVAPPAPSAQPKPPPSANPVVAPPAAPTAAAPMPGTFEITPASDLKHLPDSSMCYPSYYHHQRPRYPQYPHQHHQSSHRLSIANHHFVAAAAPPPPPFAAYQHAHQHQPSPLPSDLYKQGSFAADVETTKPAAVPTNMTTMANVTPSVAAFQQAPGTTPVRLSDGTLVYAPSSSIMMAAPTQAPLQGYPNQHQLPPPTNWTTPTTVHQPPPPAAAATAPLYPSVQNPYDQNKENPLLLLVFAIQTIHPACKRSQNSIQVGETQSEHAQYRVAANSSPDRERQKFAELEKLLKFMSDGGLTGSDTALQELAKKVPVPSRMGSEEVNFIVLCQNKAPDGEVLATINNIMVAYFIYLVRLMKKPPHDVTKRHYKPGTIFETFKRIFALLKASSVHVSMGKLHGFSGSLNNVSMIEFQRALAEDPTYADSAKYEVKESEMRMIIELLVRDDFDLEGTELPRVITLLLAISFLLRGAGEIHSLEWSRVVFGVFRVDHPLCGQEYVFIKGFEDKTHKLCTKHRNSVKKTTTPEIAVTCEKLNLGRLLKIYKSQCFPEQGKIHCKPYTGKQANDMRRVAAQQQGKSQATIRYNPKQNVSEESITTHLKTLARDAGVENWNRVTIDTLRPFCMPVIANDSSVTPKMVANAARHSSLETQIHYVRPNAQQVHNAPTALSLHSFLATARKDKPFSIEAEETVMTRVDLPPAMNAPVVGLPPATNAPASI